MSREEKKVILLTGCTGKLGQAFIEHYAGLYTIVGIARRKPSFQTGTFDFLQGDICQGAEEIVNYVLGKYQKIDALINAAVHYDWAELKDKKRKIFEQELATNVIAPLELANKILRDFWTKAGREENTKRNRSIVNVSSISAIMVSKNSGLGGYSATKAALNMLTRYMAHEYATYGIRVNALLPTTFPDLIPTEKVAAAVHEFIENQDNGIIKVLGKDKDYLI